MFICNKMKKIKNVILFLIIFFVLINSVSAYKVRFMYPYSDEDKEYFLDKINSINQSYFEGLNEIIIYNPEKTLFNWAGLFIPYASYIYINANSGNFDYVLKHELAHLNLFIEEGGLSYCNIYHLECFKEIEIKILSALY